MVEEIIRYVVRYGRGMSLTLRRFKGLTPGEEVSVVFVTDRPGPVVVHDGDFRVTQPMELASAESGGEICTVEGLLLNCRVLAGRVVLRYYEKNQTILLLRP